jgi:hypothetical protein
MKFSARDKETAARRNVSLLRGDYPRIAMSYMIEIMEEIADDYKAEADLLEGIEGLL